MEAGTERQMVGFVREKLRNVQSYVYGVKALRVFKNKVHLKYVGDTEGWRKYSGFMVFGTGKLKQDKSGE